MQNSSYNQGPWFNTKSLEKLCYPAAWASGMLIYLRQQVLSLDINPQGQSWELMGEVKDTPTWPHEVRIEMSLTPDGQVTSWDSLCDCKVGIQCKHAVALMLKAAPPDLSATQHIYCWRPRAIRAR